MTADPLRPLPLLILSDGKPGHLNQSLALARHLGRAHLLVEVGFRNRFCKALSYLADRCHLHLPQLLRIGRLPGPCCAVVAAGSETYYAARLLARSLAVPCVAVMLPRGYRLDFDLIIAPEHDRPPQRRNILTLPVNLSFVEPRGIFQGHPGERYVGVIIGGPNRSYAMPPATMRRTLEQIVAAFPEHRLVVTTSRRTPAEIEDLLDDFPFSEKIVFSRHPVNPIPDFLTQCEVVFLTADSTSMISEAVTVGRSRVEIIPLPELRRGHKYARLIARLEELGCVHRFGSDGRPGAAACKIDLARQLRGVRLCA